MLGWDVRRSSADVVLLGRDSRIGMPGELLFALRPDGLLFATFVHHQHGGHASDVGGGSAHPRADGDRAARSSRQRLAYAYSAGVGWPVQAARPAVRGGGGATAGSPGAVGTFGPGA